MKLIITDMLSGIPYSDFTYMLKVFEWLVPEIINLLDKLKLAN